jgi:hypothetical protein
MALHHEIYWVGKQWAVTGYGVQACNQKQKGKFDIEGSRLWEDGLLESLRAEKWLNAEDLDKALDVARKYYPEPPRKAASSKAKVSRAKADSAIDGVSKDSIPSASASIDTTPKANGVNATPAKAVVPEASVAKVSVAKPSAPADLPKALATQLPKHQPKPPAQKFSMRINAKLVPVWRIRIRPGAR